MKTINEIAEEMLDEHLEYSKNESLVYKTGFEEGATCVLSILFDASYKEDWISNPKEGVRRFFEIYKELKKYH